MMRVTGPCSRRCLPIPRQARSFRVIYYWWTGGSEFWLFTLYDKGEAPDLTSAEKAMVRELIKAELAARAE